MLAVAAPPLAYALFLVVLNALGPEALRPILKYRDKYNTALALYSVYACTVTLSILYQDGRFASAHALMCVSSKRMPAFWLESKILEWCDSCFIMARGRKPSNLHVFHHAVTPSIVLLEIIHGPSPLFLVATALNLAVHAGMYWHYRDPVAMAPCRRWITRAQIAQHGTMTILLFAAMCLHANGVECEVPVTRYKTHLVFYAWLLRSFVMFYVADGKQQAREKRD